MISLSIQLISNKHPDGSLEIEKWLRENRNRIPNANELKQKLEEHNKLLNEHLSSKEIDDNIMRKAKKIA